MINWTCGYWANVDVAKKTEACVGGNFVELMCTVLSKNISIQHRQCIYQRCTLTSG